MKPNTSTLSIKARVFNKWRAKLYKKFHPSVSIKKFEMTQEEITEFVQNMRAAHYEVSNYKAKRKYKAEIHAKRVARGYKFKKKTSLAQYEDKMRDALISKVS